MNPEILVRVIAGALFLPALAFLVIRHKKTAKAASIKPVKKAFR
jgi:hypothetical protein